MDISLLGIPMANQSGASTGSVPYSGLEPLAVAHVISTDIDFYIESMYI